LHAGVPVTAARTALAGDWVPLLARAAWLLVQCGACCRAIWRACSLDAAGVARGRREKGTRPLWYRACLVDTPARAAASLGHEATGRSVTAAGQAGDGCAVGPRPGQESHVPWPLQILVNVGAHLAFAAQALGLGQGRLDVGHADVEDDVAWVAGTSAYAARDACLVGGRDAVNEAVVWCCWPCLSVMTATAPGIHRRRAAP
jgi:hypothetical protein